MSRPTRVSTSFPTTPDTSGFGNPYLANPDFHTEMAVRKEVVYQAQQDSKRSWPEMRTLESRVDEVAARLTTLDEARQRVGHQLGSQPGTTPVWWVRVRGYFRYQGLGPEVAEAREWVFVYDGKTGDLIYQSISPATPTPASTSCPEAFDPSQVSVHVFPPERWSPKGLLPVDYAIVKASDGKVYTVYAGGQPDDTFQGTVVIAEGAPDPCANATTPAQGTMLVEELRGGAFRIVQVDGDLVLLETTERNRIWLDYLTHQFGEIVAPGVNPPTPDPAAIGRPPVVPTPRGDLLQPRSTPVSAGKAYSFRLWTHCGIDWNVDFAGRFWDLDDPAWAGQSRPGVGNPYQDGTMTLVDPDHAVFRFGLGEIRFKRHEGSRYVPWCA